MLLAASQPILLIATKRIGRHVPPPLTWLVAHYERQHHAVIASTNAARRAARLCALFFTTQTYKAAIGATSPPVTSVSMQRRRRKKGVENGKLWRRAVCETTCRTARDADAVRYRSFPPAYQNSFFFFLFSRTGLRTPLTH